MPERLEKTGETAGPRARGGRRSAIGDPAAAAPPLLVRRLGTVPYQTALELQADLVSRRRAAEVPDQLLLLQHPHVITLGSSADRSHVLLDDAERRLMGIELFETGRGGDVTYHGPGQLVGYPILDLKHRRDLHRYVRDIEEVLIRALGELGLESDRRAGLTGVWVEDRKIAAIGVRVSSGWITSHGFALNVNSDLSFFGSIVPCGIREHGVTSLADELGAAPEDDRVMTVVAEHFGRVFQRTPSRVA